MRTDTRSFADNAFKAVRALGVNSVNGKRLARQIVIVANHGGYDAQGSEIPPHTIFADLRVSLEFAFSGFQYVAVNDGDRQVFTVTANGGAIVSTDPTPRQIELAEAMQVAGRAVFSLSADLCGEWEDANGYPTTFEAADRRGLAVNTDPRMVAAHAAYDALRDESLALNPYAHPRIIDWRQWSLFSDWYKEESGSRPSTGWRYADMVRWIERETQDETERLAA